MAASSAMKMPGELVKKAANQTIADLRAYIASLRTLRSWLLVFFAICVSNAQAQTLNGVVLNQQYVDSCSSPHTYEIATLPGSDAGTYDHLHLVATLGGNWLSTDNSTIDATFGNRNSFSSVYTVMGASPTGSTSHLTAYQQSDGSVNLYFMINGCTTATYTVLEAQQETVYSSPTDTLGATPPGTLLFDTASSSNPPANQTNYSGNFFTTGSVGIGTTAPTYPANRNGLTVRATSSNGAEVVVQSTSGTDGTGNGLALVSASTNAAVINRLSGDLTIGTNGGSQMFIQGSTNNVGIGTTIPSVPLEVNGSVKMDSGAIIFPDGSSLSSVSALNQLGLNGSGTPAITQANGNVGIGTTNPGNALSVGVSGDGTGAKITANGGLVLYGNAIANAPTAASLVLDQQVGGVARVMASGANTWNANLALNPYGGNVGIGTTSPQARLDVNGAVRISGSGSGLTFPDGSVQSIAYTGTCPSTGGDYAESVDVEGDKKAYEPGDVMVIDPDHPGRFLMSSEPYSPLVAGIYSTKPGYVGRRQTTDPKLSTDEIPMAMVGIVPTKASTENGPIKVGDLLVTSSKPGYVMKGTDHDKMTGTIVGKALAGLKSETGVIEMLVSLQ